MDKQLYRVVNRENSINKDLTIKGGYYMTGVLSTDEVKDEDVSVNIKDKMIHINSRMTHFAFLSYIHPKWYSDPVLCRHRIPLRLVGTKIELSTGWRIINKENILLPSEVSILYNDILKKDRFGDL